MHPIRRMIERNRPTIHSPLGIDEYIDSSSYFVRKAAEALHTAHFGPRDLKFSALARAAKFRQKALEASTTIRKPRIKYISW